MISTGHLEMWPRPIKRLILLLSSTTKRLPIPPHMLYFNFGTLS